MARWHYGHPGLSMRVQPRSSFALTFLGLAIGVAPVLGAGLNVGAGAAVDLGNGRVDLNCLNFEAAGQFTLGGGTVTGANIINILTTGEVNGGNGSIRLAGDWINAGAFLPGQGSVTIEDGCANSTSALSGDNDFAGFSASTTTGKTLQLEAGSLQTFSGVMNLQGVAPENRLKIRSSSEGQPVYFVLFEQGTQQIHAVEVRDNDASGGQALAPGTPEQSASVDAGNNSNWFGQALDLIFKNSFEND